jgi:hypothetical protein
VLEVLADERGPSGDARDDVLDTAFLRGSKDAVPQAGDVSPAEPERAWQAAPGPEDDTRHPLANGSGSSDVGAKDGQARSQTVRLSVYTLEERNA